MKQTAESRSSKGSVSGSWLLAKRFLVRLSFAANFLTGDFSPLTSYPSEKSSQWFLKDELCQLWCENVRPYRCVADSLSC